MGDQSLHKVMFFGPPFWAPKGPLGLWAPRPGPGAPKMGSGAENIKVGESNTMQNPVVVAPNGAICCKLWPQNILGWGANFLGATSSLEATPLTLGQSLRPWGNPFALGQPLCPWGNPFACGATPLPVGQALCPWGNPLALGQPLCPGATLLPWRQPFKSGP